MNSDKITTLLGVGLGALHQVGLVGVVPATKSDWVKTVMSLGFVLLGYFTNTGAGA